MFRVSLLLICFVLMVATPGAVVGLLYPARTKNWERWQLAGSLLGGAALISLASVFAVWQILGSSDWLWLPAGSGLACSAAFVMIGTVCRNAHEPRWPRWPRWPHPPLY